MRYTQRLTCRKTKCIISAIIISLIAGSLLQLNAINSGQQTKTRSVLIEQDMDSPSSLEKGDISKEKRSITDYIANGNNLSKLAGTANRTKSKVPIQLSDQIQQFDDSKVVFFIGGHKCGSTSLATYLKHDPNNWNVWDPNGQFMDGGKEFCWALAHDYRSSNQFWQHFETHGSKTAVFALDACPTAIEKVHFERMVKGFPNASYLMLVRDPVDRVISEINAWMENHGKGGENIDELLRNYINVEQSHLRLKSRSMFGNILQTAISIIPRNKILIVPNPDLKRRPQHIIDKVMKHIGAKPKNVTLVESNKRKHKVSYQIPSNTTINWLRDTFYKDWEQFKRISSVHVDTVYM